MIAESPEEKFRQGMQFLNNNNLDKATKLFEKAYKEDNENARYMSYYGLCAAMRWGAIGLGIELCTRAVKKEFYKTEYYINLSRVYIKANNNKGAISALKKGLRFDPENDIIHKELIKLGARIKPVIPFMNRSNLINKFLGIFLRKTMPDIISRFKRRERHVKKACCRVK